MSKSYKKFVYFSLIICLFLAHHSFASTSDGTIDSTNRYAYGENVGWVDFGTSGGNVHVTDFALTGYAYGENIGWVSLNCSNTFSCGTVDYKISNNNEGALSGYAYGENVGWINFNPSSGGVTIDSSGIFHGSAYGETVGWIIFNCANTSSCGTVNYRLSTDWRAASTRSSGSSGGGGGGVAPSSGGGGYCGSACNPPASNPPSFQPANCPPGLICTPNATSSVTTTVTTTTSNITFFIRDLTLRSVGEDVRQLQIFLNSQGFVVATTGPGSIGNETTYFGSLTRAALVRFQKAHGITPSVGYFGPITRAFIRNLKF